MLNRSFVLLFYMFKCKKKKKKNYIIFTLHFSLCLLKRGLLESSLSDWSALKGLSKKTLSAGGLGFSDITTLEKHCGWTVKRCESSLLSCIPGSANRAFVSSWIEYLYTIPEKLK